MLLYEAEEKYKIKYPKSFRKAYESGLVDWLKLDGKQLSKSFYELVKKRDVVFNNFYIHFIPFSEIENVMIIFYESLNTNIHYRYGNVQLNTRFEFIPFAKPGRDSRNYFMFAYDKENPSASPAVVLYYTKEAVMFTCAVGFEDLMFRDLVRQIKNDRKYGIKPNNESLEVILTYAKFLSGKRAELATDGQYDELIKMYDEYMFTENGIILDKHKTFRHLTIIDEENIISEEIKNTVPDKLNIDGRVQNISVSFDDIRYIEADDKVSCIRLEKNSVHCNKPLSFIEPLLPEDRFFRCHKSFIIGFKHITTHLERSVIFDNGEKAIISKRKHGEFKKKYTEYLKKG